jgi:uncharacterized protein with PIN domain
MGSLKRKLRRNKEKKLNKQMMKQISMFGKLEECTSCRAPFDKTSKEHAKTWRVAVREKEQKVNLYCPRCWNNTMELIKEIENDYRVQLERGSESSEQGES